MKRKNTFKLHDGKHGAALTVRVTPRARRNEISDVYENGTIRIRVAASKRDGEANQALIGFLAEVLDVDPARIEIVAGEDGLDKIVSVLEMSSAEAETRIKIRLEEAGSAAKETEG